MTRFERYVTRPGSWYDGKRQLSLAPPHKENNRHVKYYPDDGGIPRHKSKAEMGREEGVRKASEGVY